jgi:hypothetical protein
MRKAKPAKGYPREEGSYLRGDYCSLVAVAVYLTA